MGFDISYHPIKKEEIKEWYFDALKDASSISKTAQQFNIDDFYQQKYIDIIQIALQTQPSETFETTHGYYIANIQGICRTYFYTRGAAYSFLISEKPYFKNYTTDLKALFSDSFENPVSNSITTNYSSGVYVSEEQVAKLLHDYQTDEKVKNDLDNFYSHGRIDVFLKALQYAKENGLGMLEATEVVEPNPMDLNQSKCYSNLFNCDRDGALLYREAAMEQIRAIEEQNNMQSGEIANKAAYVTTQVPETEQKEKKGFWKRLIG
jgi:hypothetical protein